MLLTEWNDDEYREVIREEAIAEGRTEGIAEGIEQGIERGISQGIEQGISQGIEQGISQGIERGRAEERADVARGMKADGEPVAKIARYTGLPEEAIAAL